MRRWLAVCLAAYVASRLLFLFTAPPYALFGQRWEELGRGAMGQGLLDGLPLTWHEWRADDYSGGSLVVGTVAAAVFRLAGPSLLALKLVPLAVSTLGLAFWLLALDRAAGRRRALLFGALYTLSPPLWTTYSLTAMGFHSEAALATAIVAWALARPGPQGSRFYAGLGLLCGFAVWFVYTAALTVVALFLWWMLGRVRPRASAFLAGAALGFLPWLLLNARTEFGGLVIGGRLFWEHALLWAGAHEPGVPWRQLLMRAFTPPDHGARDVRIAVNLAWTFLLLGPVFLYGFIRSRSLLAWLARRRSGAGPLELALLHVAVYAAAWLLTDFKDPRYAVAVLPSLFALVAHAVAVALEQPAWRRPAQALLATGFAVAVAGHVAFFPPTPSTYVLWARGYTYAWVPCRLLDNTVSWRERGPNLEQTLEARVRAGWRLRAEAIGETLTGRDRVQHERALYELVARASGAALPANVARELPGVPARLTPYFYNMLGRSGAWTLVAARHPGVAWSSLARDRLQAATDAVALLPGTPDQREAALEGLFQEWAATIPADVEPGALAGSLDVSPAPARGLGRYALHWTNERRLALDDVVSADWLRASPAWEWILEGLGEAVVHQWWFGPWPPRVSPRDVAAVQGEARTPLLRGVGRGLGYHDPCDEGTYWQARVDDVLPAADAALVRRGRALTSAMAWPCY